MIRINRRAKIEELPANDSAKPRLATEFLGSLEGRTIRVHPDHMSWFKNAAEGSGLDPRALYRVVHEFPLGETSYVDFVRHGSNNDPSRCRSRCDGCGSAEYFQVLEI